MSCENPKSWWIKSRRCQTTRWLGIMKGCGCRNSGFCCFFFAFGWFLLACRLFLFVVLLFNGLALLILIWWWSGFFVVCVMDHWWKCISCNLEMIGGSLYAFDDIGLEASISGSSQGRMEASNRVKFSFQCARMIWFLGSMLSVVNIECPIIGLQISFLE